LAHTNIPEVRAYGWNDYMQTGASLDRIIGNYFWGRAAAGVVGYPPWIENAILVLCRW
jgi:hypothetical protein